MSFPGGSNGQFKMRLLRDDELARLLEAADHYGQKWNGGGQGWLVRRPDHPFRWPALMLLLIAYGPRIAEALLLRWGDVDFDRKTITFQTLKKFKKDANGVRHRVPTTRTLPLLEEVAARLLAYREVAPKDERVFPTTCLKSGCTIAWRAFQRMLKLAELPRFRIHDLRHTAATRILRYTKDLVVCRDTLGHSNISTTSRYLWSLDLEAKLKAVPLPVPGQNRSSGAQRE